MDRDKELLRFKTDINLYEFAKSRYGFTVDIQKTGHNNLKKENNMFMSNGRDKLIMSNKNPWMYWDVEERVGRNGKIGGDIIAFVQWQEDCNIGKARKILREYLHGSPAPTRTHHHNPPAASTNESKDLDKVRSTLKKLKPASQSDYLESRNITPETLNNPLFHGRVLMGYNKAMIFPHWNEEGICGFEFKDHEFSGFSKHGYKGLWYSQIPKKTEFLIFVESGIEALSHFQLHQPKNTAYFTPSGNWKKEVDDLIYKVVQKYHSAQIITAFNNDKGGQRQSDKIKKIIEPLDRQVIPTFPKILGGDWNDQLKATLEKKSDRSRSLVLERKISV